MIIVVILIGLTRTFGFSEREFTVAGVDNLATKEIPATKVGILLVTWTGPGGFEARPLSDIASKLEINTGGKVVSIAENGFISLPGVYRIEVLNVEIFRGVRHTFPTVVIRADSVDRVFDDTEVRVKFSEGMLIVWRD